MYTLVGLFFVSLFSIAVMIGRRLSLIRGGQIKVEEVAVFEITHIENWKRALAENAKNLAHLMLVAVLRAYIRLAYYLRRKYGETKKKLANLGRKKLSSGEQQEISKFLKIISEYKEKIRDIKHKITEEEKNS